MTENEIRALDWREPHPEVEAEFAKITPYLDKFDELKRFYSTREAKGYDLTEIKVIISEGRRLYKKGELAKADQALDKALSMLQGLEKRSEPEEIFFSETPFGIAYGSVYLGDDVSTLIKELNAGSFHINIRWYDIQPAKGEWKWVICCSM